MKKLFVCVAALLLIIAVTAQGTIGVPGEVKSSLAINAGPSFPILCYASKSIDNENAGFAKTGFNLILNYEYSLLRNLSLSGTLFYALNRLDNKVSWENGSFDMKHFQYYGMMVGPVFSKNWGVNADFNFGFAGGVARVSSPQMVYQGETIMNQNKAAAFAWSVNAGLRYNISYNSYLLFKLDHTQMKPQFKGGVLSETMKTDQHIVALNLNAGIGIKF